MKRRIVLEKEMIQRVIRTCVIFSLLVSVGFIISCSPQKGRLEKAFAGKIDTKCSGTARSCQIDLSFIDWVDWDTMTVFASGMDNLEINRILGENVVGESSYPLSLVMVLRRDGRVVYVEEAPRNVEGYDGGEVEFYEDIDGSPHRLVIYPHDAQMAVERLSGRNAPYYSLKCVNCPTNKV